MKLILILLAASSLVLQQPDFSTIITAIKEGNIAKITPYLGAEVELTIGEHDDSYHKTAATKIIKTFFEKNTVSDCKMLHSGAASDQNAYYCIGQLTAGNENYRLYIYFKKIGATYLIQEIRFEEN